jgi:putative DNA primase/helicase
MNAPLNIVEIEEPVSPAMEAFREHEIEKAARSKVVLLSTALPVESRFKALTIDQVLNMPPQQWLVDGILPQQGLAVWYGAPGSAKTFIALDLAMTVATGERTWFKRQIKSGSVLYVAGEGVHGIAGRLRAWVSSKLSPDGDGRIDIKVVPLAPNIFEGDVGEFLIEARQHKPSLIVIDTLARCAVGADENSSRDIGRVIQACDLLSNDLKCCVLVIHHAGKSGSERGSSALRGASEVMLEIKKHDDGTREIVLNGSAKLKDAQESESIYFKLSPKEESCIVIPSDEERKNSNRSHPRGQWQRTLFECASQALRDKSAMEDGRPTITFEELLDRWKGVVHDARKREPGEMRRVLRVLQSSGVLGGSEAEIWCP